MVGEEAELAGPGANLEGTREPVHGCAVAVAGDELGDGDEEDMRDSTGAKRESRVFGVGADVAEQTQVCGEDTGNYNDDGAGVETIKVVGDLVLDRSAILHGWIGLRVELGASVSRRKWLASRAAAKEGVGVGVTQGSESGMTNFWSASSCASRFVVVRPSSLRI